MKATLDSLAKQNDQSVGALHRNEGGAMVRQDFEAIVSALLRSGMISSRPDVFEKDGKSIPFHRLKLTRLGEKANAQTLAAIPVPTKVETERKAEKKSKGARLKKGRRSRATATPRTKTPAPPRAKSPARPRAGKKTPSVSPRTGRIDAALRAWRKAEATQKRLPAFRIMSDKVLSGIAATRPENETALLAVHGVGPSLVAKHGEKILEIVRDA
jgi:DNA topoisomerase-3